MKGKGRPLSTPPGAVSHAHTTSENLQVASNKASFQVHGLEYNESRHFVLLTGTSDDRRKARLARGRADADGEKARGRDAGELARAREPTTGRYVRRGTQCPGPLEASPKFFTLHLDGSGCLQEGEPPSIPPSTEGKEDDEDMLSSGRRSKGKSSQRTIPSSTHGPVPAQAIRMPAETSRRDIEVERMVAGQRPYPSRNEKHRIEFLLSGDSHDQEPLLQPRPPPLYPPRLISVLPRRKGYSTALRLHTLKQPQSDCEAGPSLPLLKARRGHRCLRRPLPPRLSASRQSHLQSGANKSWALSQSQSQIEPPTSDRSRSSWRQRGRVTNAPLA